MWSEFLKAQDIWSFGLVQANLHFCCFQTSLIYPLLSSSYLGQRERVWPPTYKELIWMCWHNFKHCPAALWEGLALSSLSLLPKHFSCLVWLVHHFPLPFMDCHPVNLKWWGQRQVQIPLLWILLPTNPLLASRLPKYLRANEVGKPMVSVGGKGWTH